MERKSASRVALGLFLTVLLMLASNAVWAGVSVSGLVRGFAGLTIQPPSPRIVFREGFEDNETQGQPPNNWTVLESSPAVGSFTVSNSTDYVASGNNSGKFVDNSTAETLVAYRDFSQLNGTIIVSLSLKFPNCTGNRTGLEVSVDDGGFNGSNIIFGDGVIQYFDGSNGLATLMSSYVANRWYKISSS